MQDIKKCRMNECVLWWQWIGNGLDTFIGAMGTKVLPGEERPTLLQHLALHYSILLNADSFRDDSSLRLC